MNHRLPTIAISLILSLSFSINRARASDALTASGLFPSKGASSVCVDTPLRMTFDAPPVLGTGQIKVMDAADNSIVQTVDVTTKTAEQTIGGLAHFNYHPVVISGNEVTIDLPDGSLAYHKTYDIVVDAGALKVGGVPFAGSKQWRFTTKSAPPAAADKMIVAADGSGDFCTVQGAIDSIPVANAKRTTVYLRKGTYTELIYFQNKNNITITGEDRRQSVIAYANNAVFNPSQDGGYHRGVLRASGCHGLVISNLTIRDTTPRGGSQAEAIILNGDLTSRAILANVDLFSFQDTLQINGQAYITNCYIEGDVDFMWGKGPCFFENCHCFGTRSKGFFAQIRNPATNHGYVYHHCIFDGPPNTVNMMINRIAPSVYPHSEIVLMDCELGKAVAPVGWQLDGTKGTTVPTTAPDIHFWEYHSHDVDGKPVDTSKRLAVSRQLKMPGDAELISNYSQPSFVLGDHWEAQSDPNLPVGSTPPN